jgi:hypothetical protein
VTLYKERAILPKTTMGGTKNPKRRAPPRDVWLARETQQMGQESMSTFMQMFNIPHSYLQAGMRLAQEDTPGSPQERSTQRDPKEDQYRRSAGQSS